MHVIVGLGNPGERYRNTRHNVGFMAVDRLEEQYGSGFRKGRGSYVEDRVHIRSVPVLLVKPTTYMNLSGQAVRQVTDFYKLDDFSRLLVVFDDFHLPYGVIRLRPSGSAGGQKGLASTLQSLHTNNIPRLRIGIGDQFHNASNYVLTAFNPREKKNLPEILDWSAKAIEAFILDGVETAMNQFNRNILED